MVDFDIKGCSRKCSKTDREIGRGEAYYSVVMYDENDQLTRNDYCESAWQGPPDECVGWWKSQVPDLEDGRVYWAPKDVLFAYFDEILAAGNQPQKLYVMALLMIRRRLMKLDDSQKSDREMLRISSARHESIIEIPVVALSPPQIERLQNELGEHLFTNRVANDPDED